MPDLNGLALYPKTHVTAQLVSHRFSADHGGCLAAAAKLLALPRDPSERLRRPALRWRIGVLRKR